MRSFALQTEDQPLFESPGPELAETHSAGLLSHLPFGIRVGHGLEHYHFASKTQTFR